MQQHKYKLEQAPFFNKSTWLTISALLSIQIFTIGCASQYHRDNFVRQILKKENNLIEKIKLERAESSLKQKIENDPELLKAEMHLINGLEEIQKANEAVTQNILNTDKPKGENGKNERSND